ncbi:MAG: DUF4266 domain-containing protein [Verrucomicrobiales bacterium]|nr:DUF4266 domain-containing protein [Verrucomicrobiales bacterium]
MNNSRRLNLVLLGLLLLGGTGCTTVKPWERGTLADWTMRPDRDPLALASDEHIYFSREATTGGRGVGGGGCGCN